MRGLKEIFLSGDVDSELYEAISRAITLVLDNDLEVQGESNLSELKVELNAEIMEILKVGTNLAIPEIRFKSDAIDDDVSIILDKNEKSLKIRVGADTNPTYTVWHRGNFNPNSKADANHVHQDIYYKQDFIDTPLLNQSEPKPIVTKSNGKIDNKFLNVSNLIPQGNFTPTTTQEYPSTNPNKNYYWVINGLTDVGYEYQTGDLAGQTLYNADELIFGANGWLVQRLEANHNHDSRYYKKDEFLNQSDGSIDAGKPVLLNGSGLIDVSMMATSTFVPIAAHDPSDVAEYPDTTGYDFGSFWWVEALANPTGTNPEAFYKFTSGDLQGKSITIGDFMVWGDGGWGIMPGEMNPILYYRLDGSQALTAPFMAGGYQLKNLADGADDEDASTMKQLNDGLATKSDSGHVHNISDIPNLRDELDEKVNNNDGFSMISAITYLTQVEYNATLPNPNTLYVIVS